MADRDDAGNVYNAGVPFGVGWDPTKSLRTSELTLERIAVYSEALTADELAAAHSAADENVLLWMDFEKVHEHSFGEWTVTTAPTCTEEGVETRTCGCGETESRKIPALGHDWKGTGCTRCDGKRENPFTDVPEDSFYIDPVLWAVGKGITTGTTDTTFDPTGSCLRGHVVTLLWRAAGSPEPTSADNPFVDVTERDYFYKPVLWALEEGITTGLDDTHFGPTAACNRAQMVTFLWRAMGEPEVSTTGHPFTDVLDDQFYFVPMLWAVENGITTGLSATTFGPTVNCNRAQAVTFLYRAYNN